MISEFLVYAFICIVFVFIILALFGELGEAVMIGVMIIVTLFTIASAFIVNVFLGFCAIVFFLLLFTTPEPRKRRK